MGGGAPDTGTRRAFTAGAVQPARLHGEQVPHRPTPPLLKKKPNNHLKTAGIALPRESPALAEGVSGGSGAV